MRRREFILGLAMLANVGRASAQGRARRVWRHFGTDVLERLHLEMRRSHPRLYRAEGVLDSLAAYAHLIWIPIEPGLDGLKDGFVLPT